MAIEREDNSTDQTPERVLPDLTDLGFIYERMVREILRDGQDAFDKKYSQGMWADDYASTH